ncbi:hemolysin family protein [Zwartia sp.]|uniref:hemolysin family protein n=1 Tax=Zwartia sp. TaxID=2978004 RepID=UPI0027205D69|nr:hemolysin family protein [Zwartia sp.]MDO9024342.1 hemolysin family protein [Zwartia sp.]
MDILILVALILLNGLFAMSEIALITSKRAKLQKAAETGDAAAKAALKLAADPNQFLSTVQVGITSIGVMSGIVGEAALAKPLALWFQTLGVDVAYSSYLGTGIVVLVITYFSIVIGELVPKRLGQSNPEVIARLIARPIAILAMATRPFVKLLSGSTKFVLRILGVKERNQNEVTQEEIQAVLEEGTEAGLIETHEHTMVKNVFRLDDRQIASLMVPRADIIYLDIQYSLEKNLEIIELTDHARFPLVNGELNQVLGIVNSRKLLSKIAKGEKYEMVDGIEEALYVPETLNGMELLANFRSSGRQMAFVVDEYGEVLGLVTLQDLIEAITGEFTPRDPAKSWAVRRDDGTWLLDGHIPVPELKDCLELSVVPEEERGRYHTLSGMFMLLSGKLPIEGDKVRWEDWQFEIMDMDRKTIDKVLATKIVEQSETPAPADQDG